MTPPTVYVADASALIELRHTYRMATFPALWRRLGELVSAGRLIVPREVRREVARDTELGPWVKQNRKIVVGPNAAQAAIVNQILQEFPRLIDWAKEIPDADPFVIALARWKSATLVKESRYVVLTCEKRRSATRPKIPDVCAYYEVPCLFGPRALGDMFEQEGWKFG
jgi:hypothetical protein